MNEEIFHYVCAVNKDFLQESGMNNVMVTMIRSPRVWEYDDWWWRNCFKSDPLCAACSSRFHHTIHFKNEIGRNTTIKLGYSNAKSHYPSESRNADDLLTWYFSSLWMNELCLNQEVLSYWSSENMDDFTINISLSASSQGVA
ncbi:hypothetical protein K439DRAFT_1620299 [Ramaria rubella]|nr:hypothetical protein K439DRAFT_1620299 [Ramaria rubella]